ncbi:IclR family transcriptional regulator [Defluviimonas sp. SAOS-178_SWC]|uniref:IclR family transcriptional regulator n=1 Tax=Defluviimonas sp. SAOS-178_SWC TaxID=3121287 RepID=UPI003221AAFE
MRNTTETSNMNQSQPPSFVDHEGHDDTKGMSSTLIRGLDVLSAFRGIQETLSNSELADRLGLPRPTITRLCNTLAHAGYLSKVKAGNFRLGLRVLELAYPVLSSMTFRQRAISVMREFAEFTGGAVSLATIHGPNLIFVQTVHLSETMRHSPEIGSTGPLYKSAMGRALLSMLDADSLRAKEAEIAAAYPEEWEVFRPRVQDGISHCREHGFVVALGDWRPGFYGAAAPIKKLKSGLYVAINCGVPEHKIAAEEFTRVMGSKVAASAKILRGTFADL